MANNTPSLRSAFSTSRRRLTVDSAADGLVQRYDIASSASTSVHVAVWDVLSALERADYQCRRRRQKFEILRDVLGNEMKVLSPEAIAKALQAATRGYRWARGCTNASRFWAAVRTTGVHVLSSNATMLLSAWQNPRHQTLGEATYVRNVATRLRIPVEKAMELLATAGIFVRAVT